MGWKGQEEGRHLERGMEAERGQDQRVKENKDGESNPKREGLGDTDR